MQWVLFYLAVLVPEHSLRLSTTCNMGLEIDPSSVHECTCTSRNHQNDIQFL